MRRQHLAPGMSRCWMVRPARPAPGGEAPGGLALAASPVPLAVDVVGTWSVVGRPDINPYLPDDLAFFGLRQVRAKAEYGNTAATVALLKPLVDAGIGLTLIHTWGSSIDVKAALGRNHITAMEGPNEINSGFTPFRFDALTGVPAAVALQASLCANVKAASPGTRMLAASQSISRPAIGIAADEDCACAQSSTNHSLRVMSEQYGSASKAGTAADGPERMGGVASSSGAAPRDIRALTGLRGVAAAWVFLFHYDIVTDGTLPWVGTALVSRGYLAVDVFFALSGFILTLSYGHLFRDGFDLGRYGTYIWRRLARVYPIYILATVAVIVLNLAAHRYDAREAASLLATNALLIENWGLSGPAIPAAWSLSVEFAAYLLLPVLLALLWQSHQAVAALAVGVCVATLAWLTTWPSNDPILIKRGLLDVYWGHSAGPMLRCLADFSLGIVAYRACQAPRLAGSLASPILCMVVAAALVTSASLPGGDVPAVLLAPLLVACLATGRGSVVVVLSSAACVWLGDVSYSFYLWHQSLLRIGTYAARWLAPRIGDLPAGLAGLAVASAVTLVVASASYRLVERPARRFLTALGSHAQRRAVTLSETRGGADMAKS